MGGGGKEWGREKNPSKHRIKYLGPDSVPLIRHVSGFWLLSANQYHPCLSHWKTVKIGRVPFLLSFLWLSLKRAMVECYKIRLDFQDFNRVEQSHTSMSNPIRHLIGYGEESSFSLTLIAVADPTPSSGIWYLLSVVYGIEPLYPLSVVYGIELSRAVRNIRKKFSPQPCSRQAPLYPNYPR